MSMTDCTCGTPCPMHGGYAPTEAEWQARWAANRAIEAEARQQERDRIAAEVEAIDPTSITDSQGYRIDSADAMRRAVLAVIRGEP